MKNRLETIVTHERHMRARDLLFAAGLALAALGTLLPLVAG